MTSASTQGIKTVLDPVSDLATAKAVYATPLGVPPQTDGSYHIGFEVEGQHIALVPGGRPLGMTSPVPTGTCRTSRRSRSRTWESLHRRER